MGLPRLHLLQLSKGSALHPVSHFPKEGLTWCEQGVPWLPSRVSPSFPGSCHICKSSKLPEISCY